MGRAEQLFSVTARAGQSRQPPHSAPDSALCPTTRFLCLRNKNPLREKKKTKHRQTTEKASEVRIIQGQGRTQLKLKLLRAVRKTKEIQTINVIPPLNEVTS